MRLPNYMLLILVLVSVNCASGYKKIEQPIAPVIKEVKTGDIYLVHSLADDLVRHYSVISASQRIIKIEEIGISGDVIKSYSKRLSEQEFKEIKSPAFIYLSNPTLDLNKGI